MRGGFSTGGGLKRQKVAGFERRLFLLAFRGSNFLYSPSDHLKNEPPVLFSRLPSEGKNSETRSEPTPFPISLMDPNLPPEETTPPVAPAPSPDPVVAGSAEAPPTPEAQPALENPSPESEPVQEVSEPGGEADTEPAPVGETPVADTDPLTALADQALKGRLSPAEEERVSTLLKEALLEGRKGVERVVEQLPKLPWIVGVNSVSCGVA